MNTEQQFLLALIDSTSITSTRINLIYKKLSSYQKIFEANKETLQKYKAPEKSINNLLEYRQKNTPEKIYKKYKDLGIKMLFQDNPAYPNNLLKTTDPPLIIFYKGDIQCLYSTCISIVGARNFSYYGQEVVEHLLSGLQNTNITIVSGLAIGIDTLAHTNSLKYNLKTIGILGSGINLITPTTNTNLANQITSQNGAILSEFPLNTQASKYTFPKRNRIIAGLSIATLIIEAKKKSGSLITAELAKKLDRQVWAIPGNIFSEVSSGTNYLIKQKATPITSSQDILDILKLTKKSPKKETTISVELNPTEKIIYKHLNHEPIHINELTKLTKLDTNIINSTLTIMEINEIVKNIGNSMYIKTF